MTNDNKPPLLEHDGKYYHISRERPIFNGYVRPYGWLENTIASHALFRYYLAARLAYEHQLENMTAYEGDKDSGVNYKQLFTGIANWYQVSPEEMIKHWASVDLQCGLLGLPKLPDRPEMRFNGPIVVK